ncbi:MAG: AMP-binding protein [Ilumatobacter sp.]|uniref:AMP-binding protein n=1 Tax=Ilumatobacter sp. TaxID=1967498 RepID=UPI00260222C7|nr:AMP-binding protein [Ilumatobacter sp.]MDJ0767400.1 AMP-binding protein [Ilumatobacter sp.]
MGDASERVNLAHLIEGHDADRVALISRNRETTYGVLREQVAGLRGGLAAAGVGHGDRVAILCGNNRYFVVTYLATIGLGAVAVPLNPDSPGPELQHELGTVEPAAVVVGPHALPSWSHVDLEALPSVRSVIVAEGDAPEGTLHLADLFEHEPVPIVDVEPGHVAVLMFTSGTAGPPRAAMLSHRNLMANIEQDLTARDHTVEGDVVYSVLPLFHIFGLNVVLGVALTVGATIVLVQRFDPATAAQSIVRRQVTIVPGAPPMWIAFCHFDELPSDSFKSVRLALSGASRLSPAVAERFEERFGIPIYEGYGLTEASPVVTSSAGMPTRPGSVGRVLVGMDVRVVDEHGQDVPVGDAGEVWVRGENVFLGYWNEREATDRVLVDGWLHTGDIATVDHDGYMYLVDRAKDLIIVSGFNVFPAEVEAVLRSHPAVAEVGVLGVPHPHHGEAVKAYVVLTDGADVDEDSLIGHALDYLARYKCPSKVVFVDELPRSATGKLIRRELEGTIIGD